MTLTLKEDTKLNNVDYKWHGKYVLSFPLLIRFPSDSSKYYDMISIFGDALAKYIYDIISELNEGLNNRGMQGKIHHITSPPALSGCYVNIPFHCSFNFNPNDDDLSEENNEVINELYIIVTRCLENNKELCLIKDDILYMNERIFFKSDEEYKCFIDNEKTYLVKLTKRQLFAYEHKIEMCKDLLELKINELGKSLENKRGNWDYQKFKCCFEDMHILHQKLKEAFEDNL